jgi:putative transposase
MKKYAGVNQICRLLGISKDSYYHSTDPMIKLNDKYKYLKSKIQKIIELNPAYGKMRIKQALYEKYGLAVNHKLLLKLLKLWGLSFHRILPKKDNNWITKTLNYLEMRSNLLRTLISLNMLAKCLQVIVSDVTEIHFSGIKAYLCVHMDFVGKAILGWELSLHPDKNLVITSYKNAIARLKKFGITDFKNIIQHQDRGSVYTSKKYILTVLKNKMQLSFSRTGEPGDNAVNESFFSRLKAEWNTEFIDCKTFEQLYNKIKYVIHYYNYKRYHSSIGYKQPMLYLQGYLSHLKN